MISELINLFFPERCPVCGDALTEGAQSICTKCLYDMPFTDFELRADNPVTELFWGMFPIVNGCSMFWFTQGGGCQRLIHSIKYRNGWRYAQKMGSWFGARLDDSGLYGDVDVIVPVPLHWRRVLERGFNQSEYIARGISATLGVPVQSHAVVRRKYNTPQAITAREKRWENVADKFAVVRPQRLAGKHILLVDDVLTSGATLASCAEAILAAVPDCRISIATLAISKNEVLRKAYKSKKL